MKTLLTWAPPLATSLLLHTALLVLVMYRLSIFKPESIDVDTPQSQTLSVQLNLATATLVNKPPIQDTKPVTLPEPVLIATPTESPNISAALPEPIVPNLTATEAQITTTQDVTPVTNNPPSPTIQAFNKLSRIPKFLQKIEPVYPNAEKNSGSQATVVAEVTIDETGKITQVRIVKSAGTYFDNAVIEALNKSHFSPAYIDKDAVATRVNVPFRFKLN